MIGPRKLSGGQSRLPHELSLLLLRWLSAVSRQTHGQGRPKKRQCPTRMHTHTHTWEPPSATCEEQTLLDHSSRTEQRARECLSPCTCRAGRRKQSQSEARFYESTNQCRLTEHHNHPTWSRTLRGFNGSEHPVYPGISIKPPRLALKAPCTPPPPIALAGSVSSVDGADQLRPALPGSALPLLHPRLLGLTHASRLFKSQLKTASARRPP